MPRYYFNVREHDRLEKDLEGAEFATDDLAYEEAVMAAREMMSEKVLQGAIVDGQVFEVTDADGRVIHTVPLKSVVRYG